MQAKRAPEGPKIIRQTKLHSFQDVSTLSTQFSAVSKFLRSAVGLTAGAADRTHRMDQKALQASPDPRGDGRQTLLLKVLFEA